MFVRLSIITLGLVFAQSARAQMDPSSALLLNGGRNSNSAIDSGRYTIRPKAEGPRKDDSRNAKKPRENQEDNADPVTVTVPAGQTVETPAPNSPPQTAVQPLLIRCERSEDQSNCGAQPVFKDSGRRLNLIDLSFAPGYLYNSSESNYSYRSYNLATPSLMVDANVWLNSGFSLHGAYTGTLSGHVSDSWNGSKNVPAMQEWFLTGIRTRRFFSADSRGPLIMFGVDYFDYQFRVPTDAVIREKLRSSGVQISLESEIPVGPTRVWTMGVIFAPKLRHVEGSTGVDFQSGGNVDANAVGISIGGRAQFERHDAIFWKISHRVEKDLFSGDATKADPLTGLTPTGVEVTNSFTLFELGYTWSH